LGARWRADDLVDALMVEPDGYASWGEKNGHAIAHHKRFRVVYLEPPSPMQFHREHAEWLSISKGLKNSVKVVRRHREILMKRPGK
jgi:hypothetical protein